MKYLFFLLILFNIVFFLWETGVGRSPMREDRAKAASDGEERIVLVQELPKPSKAAEPPASLAHEAGQTPASPTPAPQPPAAANPPAENPEPPKTEAPAPLDDNAQACFRLGPFASAKQAKLALSKLGTDLRLAAVVKKPVEFAKDYLVLYPVASSLEAAQANRKMLVEKGYKDAWLIDQGENRYAISLALFKSKAQAEQAMARFLTQGIQAELKPRLGLAGEKWWLEVRQASGRDKLEALVGPSSKQSASFSIKTCD